eukprot:evm.model.scf_446EXC.4 EVM.evm.TU.scf_446EXC.4   scf_446EXC:43619-46402(+)
MAGAQALGAAARGALFSCRPGRPTHARWNGSWSNRDTAVGLRRGYVARCTGGKGFAEGEESSQKVADADNAEDSPEIDIEDQILRRRKPKVKVVSPAVQQYTGEEPQTPMSELENTVVLVLFSLLGFCILEGIILAASGFLPEGIDELVEAYLYPAFSPTVGVFLVGSVLYGLWKTSQQK